MFLITRECKRHSGFTGDSRGSAAVIFALAILPVTIVLTGALDYVRIIDFKRKLEATADQVATSTVGGERLDESQRRDKGRSLLIKALAQRGIDVSTSSGKVDVKQTGDDAEAIVTIEAPYKLMFGGLIGLPSVKVRTSRSASNHASDQEKRLFACLSAESDEDYEKLACDGV